MITLNAAFDFFYWRDKNRLEVELIIARSLSKPVVAIEFKSSTDPQDHDLDGLTAFAEDYPDVPLYCFCQTSRAYELPSGIQVLPWHEGLALINNL